MKTDRIKRIIEAMLLLLFAIFIAFTICMLSPCDFISPHGVDGIDSSVFIYMGRIIDKGLLPYKDAWDHKGVLLYFINWLGVLVPYNHGIWFVELFFMLMSVIGGYKLARLVAGKVQSALVIVIVFSLMYVYFEGGNLTEEYALPMQIWSLFIIFDYLFNNRVSFLRLIVCGACFAAVCFIRINMIPVWITFCGYIFIKLIVMKEYKQLCKLVIGFLIGIAIVTIPLCVFLVSNGIWNDFIDDYFIFNIMYSQDETRSNAMQKLCAAVFFLNNQIVMIAIACSVLNLFGMNRCVFEDKNNKQQPTLYKNHEIDRVYIIYLILNILLISMSGQQYGHYGIAMLPMLIYPLSTLIGRFDKCAVKHLNAVVIATVYIIIALAGPNWIGIINNMSNDITNHTINDDAWIDQNYHCLIEYIDENTTSSDLITVYGNEVSIYNYSNRFSASKYTYQTRADVAPSILDDYYADLDHNNVQLIVMTSTPDERMEAFIVGHNFVNTQTFGPYTVYEIQDAIS